MDNQLPFISYSEKRPWGEFIQFTHGQSSTVKIITVNANEAFSLQTHSERDEFWFVLEGSGKIITGNTEEDIVVGKEYYIPRGMKHRITASSIAVKILEISFGNFKEGDVVRIEDKYNRT